MHTGKSTIVIELGRKCQRLLIPAPTHVLSATGTVFAVFSYFIEYIHSVVGIPNRFIYGIGIRIRLIIAGRVVDGETSLKTQSFYPFRHIEIQSYRHFKLTGSAHMIATGINISKGIRLILLATSQKILTINQMTTVLYRCLQVAIVIYRANRYQR